MKRFLLCLLVLLLIGTGVYFYFVFSGHQEEKKLEEIKEGWYVEITYKTPINVRETPSSDAKSLGKVQQGESYKVYEVDTESSNTYFWYKIDFNGKEGWIASGKKNPWVKDHNNPEDIMTPQIKFEDDEVHFRTIDDINYKHLTVVEDKDDYEITHTVYHEVDKIREIDQYWILYTITDGVGKSSSKMQKIIFDVKPDEDRVTDFQLYKR